MKKYNPDDYRSPGYDGPGGTVSRITVGPPWPPAPDDDKRRRFWCARAVDLAQILWVAAAVFGIVWALFG